MQGRVHALRSVQDATSQAGPVVYWASASIRVTRNLALQHACQLAMTTHSPLLVLFRLSSGFPKATSRSWAFLLQGVREFFLSLRTAGLRAVLVDGDAAAAAVTSTASHIVLDRGYLRYHRKAEADLLASTTCPVDCIEDNVVVPVEVASTKSEYAARLLRPKINKLLSTYLKSSAYPADVNYADVPSYSDAVAGDLADALCACSPAATSVLAFAESVFPANSIDYAAPPVDSLYPGGEAAALAMLDTFVNERFDTYTSVRNDPAQQGTSCLSFYLSFGHISPLTVALRVNDVSSTSSASRQAFLEEMVVRRELSFNFVWYNPDTYDSPEALPNWAKRTLSEHESDKRQYLYTKQQLEDAETHDDAWNAAQREMVLTGRMSGYMRMYWGKKIIEWTPNYQTAHELMIDFNDRYELDGRSANGFVGVAWCLGLHDRPWARRPIFGMVRYMAHSGLERKFSVANYIISVSRRADAIQVGPSGGSGNGQAAVMHQDSDADAVMQQPDAKRQRRR